MASDNLRAEYIRTISVISANGAGDVCKQVVGPPPMCSQWTDAEKEVLRVWEVRDCWQCSEG